jgi:dsDNA-specific endonuclease/ATPase MutS2
MDAKLTLKLDSEVIEKAKAYAEDRGESLSRMVENYFLGLTREQRRERDEAEPRGVVAELAGLLAGAEIGDEKAAYAEYLSKKYS